MLLLILFSNILEYSIYSPTHFVLLKLNIIGSKFWRYEIFIRPNHVIIGQSLNDRFHNGRVVLEPKVVKLLMISLRLFLKQ